MLRLDLSVQGRTDLDGIETGQNSTKGVVRDAAFDTQKAAVLLHDLPRPLFDPAQRAGAGGHRRDQSSEDPP